MLGYIFCHLLIIEWCWIRYEWQLYNLYQITFTDCVNWIILLHVLCLSEYMYWSYMCFNGFRKCDKLPQGLARGGNSEQELQIKQAASQQVITKTGALLLWFIMMNQSEHTSHCRKLTPSIMHIYKEKVHVLADAVYFPLCKCTFVLFFWRCVVPCMDAHVCIVSWCDYVYSGLVSREFTVSVIGSTGGWGVTGVCGSNVWIVWQL